MYGPNDGVVYSSSSSVLHPLKKRTSELKIALQIQRTWGSSGEDDMIDKGSGFSAFAPSEFLYIQFQPIIWISRNLVTERREEELWTSCDKYHIFI